MFLCWPPNHSCRPTMLTQPTLSTSASNVTVVALGPEYENLDENLLDALQELLIDTADQIGLPLLVVDLSHTKFFGSSFIESLFRTWNRIKKRGGRFALCGLTAYCREVIGVTHLDRVWEIFPDQEAAVSTLGTAQSVAESKSR